MNTLTKVKVVNMTREEFQRWRDSEFLEDANEAIQAKRETREVMWPYVVGWSAVVGMALFGLGVSLGWWLR